MNPEVFRNISKIIERDSKVSTYKFALLRGTIDIIQENSPYLKIVGDRVYIPVGLLVEKWMVYYYPILDSPVAIPQNYGTTNLAFIFQFRTILDFYRDKGGISSFYNDLRSKGIPLGAQPAFIELTQKLRDTITRMPMKYLGRSLTEEYYSVYRLEEGGRAIRGQRIDQATLIDSCGTFSIPLDYFEGFQIIGSFVGGQDSILFKWAEFSVNAGSGLPLETVLHSVLQSPITERDVAESKRLYRSLLSETGTVNCVWTGKAITAYDVDHLIPFAIWKNNDLWNLLPSTSKVNGQKRDKIPSPELIDRSRERIAYYWERIFAVSPDRFQKEIKTSLLGDRPIDNWQNDAIAQLKRSCNYLIETRGFQAWNN
jgi:hypothetical protein